MKKLNEMTKKELYVLAQEKGVKDRSKMDKAQLLKALKPSQVQLAKQFLKAKKENKSLLKLNLQFFASASNNDIEVEFIINNNEENAQTDKDKEEIIKYIEENLNDSNNILVLDDTTKEDYLLQTEIEMLWAFNTNFIMNHLKKEINEDLSNYDYEQLEKALEHLQEKLCEGANSIIKAITDYEKMIFEAVFNDGYGHYLNGYDSTEYDINVNGTDYYIYYR